MSYIGIYKHINISSNHRYIYSFLIEFLSLSLISRFLDFYHILIDCLYEFCELNSSRFFHINCVIFVFNY